jgi:hypothetical protein
VNASMDLNDVGMMERVAPVIAQNQIVLGHKGIDLLINAVLYVEVSSGQYRRTRSN